MHQIIVSEPSDLSMEGLHEEVNFLNRRLRQLGIDGDCAYEKALQRIYQSMLSDRLQRLHSGQPIITP